MSEHKPNGSAEHTHTEPRKRDGGWSNLTDSQHAARVRKMNAARKRSRAAKNKPRPSSQSIVPHRGPPATARTIDIPDSVGAGAALEPELIQRQVRTAQEIDEFAQFVAAAWKAVRR